MFGNLILGTALALTAMTPMAANAQKTTAAQKAASARAAKATPTPTPTPAQYTPEEYFAKIDRNGNGRITKQEMKIFGMENRLGAIINTRTWKRVDKDKNGWISKDEITGYISKTRERAAKSSR